MVCIISLPCSVLKLIYSAGTEDGGYRQVLLFAIGAKALAFVLGLTHITVDYRALGKGMTMTKKKREEVEAGIADRDVHPLIRRVSVKQVTIAGLMLLGAMAITAWVILIKYLL